MTPEALVLHFIDDLDSKLNQFSRFREEGSGVLWHRGLGRHVYLAELEPEEVAGADEDDPPAEAAEGAEAAAEAAAQAEPPAAPAPPTLFDP